MHLVAIDHAAEDRSVTSQTIRNYIRRGQLKAYRVAGQRGHLVDIDEVRRVVTASRYGTFGPQAVVLPAPSNFSTAGSDRA